ncbi:unnamed protein product [Ambrosiozyma monospora]|uniref:Unnamed protein product n=1 Tax=Ambrosiozyma monospora TaxID=43982 RepID=A0A9W7DJP8_AMBMO|nr:unnamed protein product [Ambrosiozyma monospora]
MSMSAAHSASALVEPQERMRSFSFPKLKETPSTEPILYYNPTLYSYKRNIAVVPSTSQIIEDSEEEDSEDEDETEVSSVESTTTTEPLTTTKSNSSSYWRKSRKFPFTDLLNSPPSSLDNLYQISKEQQQPLQLPSRRSSIAVGATTSTSTTTTTTKAPSVLSPLSTSSSTFSRRQSLTSPRRPSFDSKSLVSPQQQQFSASPLTSPRSAVGSPSSSYRPHHAHRRSGSLSGAMITNDLVISSHSSFKSNKPGFNFSFGSIPDPNNNDVQNDFFTPPMSPKTQSPTSNSNNVQLAAPIEFKKYFGSVSKDANNANDETQDKLSFSCFDGETTTIKKTSNLSSPHPFASPASSPYASLSPSPSCSDDESDEFCPRRSVVYRVTAPTRVSLNLDDVFKASYN